MTVQSIGRMSGTVVTTNQNGRLVRFFVENPEDHMQECHWNGRFYAPRELEFLWRSISPGARILDVGSNVGNHIIFYEKFLHSTRVVAIEPNYKIADILRINCLINELKSVDLTYVEVGLSDEEARGGLLVPANNSGAAKMVTDRGSIRIVTGDSIFSNQEFDFIKIDVEGMEMNVLRGLRNTILKNRPVLFVEVDHENRPEFESWIEANQYVAEKVGSQYAANENFFLRPR